ncbi:MAG: protein kinase [Acidobacteria bacterium]|nr:protein kinase [Acidobacteriota bacterium]
MANTFSGTLSNLLKSRDVRATFSIAQNFRSRFGFRWWYLPAAVLVLGALGFTANTLLEQSIKQQKATELETLLSADVTALEVWFDSQKGLAELLGQDPVVRDLVVQLSAYTDRESLLAAAAQRELRTYMAPIARTQRYLDYLVTGPDGLVLSAGFDTAVGNLSLTRHFQFVFPALDGQTLVSRPFRAEIPLPDDTGQPSWGRPTMFVAAPVLDAEGGVIAALGLRIRPEIDFTRILHVARPGETGETYAFDVNGLMVSQSRFDSDLRDIGLLPPDPNVRAIFNIEIRDPGGNMVTGFTPAQPRAKQPLTHMAANAVEGLDGVNVDGYRDYRGVDVIGAWRWLGDYGFGIATEIDVAEAFVALHRVRWLFRGLFLLLVLASTGTLLATVSLARLGDRADAAMARAKRLGQYTLEKRIGKGGMGEVYRASHALLRRPTAIKLLPPGREGAIELARFEREVQATSQLTHPNTVAIYDYGHTPDGLFYYAMEYLPGLQLAELVTQHGALPAGRAVRLLLQVTSSLAEAHDAGLVHRDVKPANVILCERGGLADFAKVVDFGIVKGMADDPESGVTREGVFAGTPEYASPEQIRGREVDGRSDVYSLGALAYYLLSGGPPFTGSTPLDVCRAHLSDAPAPFADRGVSGVPEELEMIVMRCLAKDPEQRFQTMLQLRRALRDTGLEEDWRQADARTWWDAHRPDYADGDTGTATSTGDALEPARR